SGLVVEKQTTYGFFWSMFWAFFWSCDQDLSKPWHPLLQHWGRTWETLLSMRDGPRIKQALDQAMPKSQLIIARKPADAIPAPCHSPRRHLDIGTQKAEQERIK